MSQVSSVASDVQNELHNQQTFTTLGKFKGEVVAVRRVKTASVTLNRRDLIELQAVREIWK